MSVCGAYVNGGCRLKSIFGNMSISPPKLYTKDQTKVTGNTRKGLQLYQKHTEAPGNDLPVVTDTFITKRTF